jgi:hypothetical protein
MTSLTRSLLTVTAGAAALTVLLAGCGGASSTVVGAALSSTAPSASAPASAQAAPPSTSAAVTATSSPAQAAPPSTAAAGSATPAQARVVYLAEGGSVGGTSVHAPACGTGCPLSGDGTTSLWDMTWPTWNSAVAVGQGTEKLDDCTPNCAAGTLHAVRVAVTLSRPVMACVAGTRKWFWTRVSFTWPDGLPAAFSGGNAPLNPFDYPDITAQSAKSCP